MNLEALRAPLSQDLRPLSAFLVEKGVPHQISEQQGEQVVWVLDRESSALVRAFYERFMAGELPQSTRERVAQGGEDSPLPPGRAKAFVPVTLTLITLSLLGAALASLSPELASLFSYYQLTAVENGYLLSEAPGQYWRLFTPVFLHFGLLHITFNALWVWELGRRIEFHHGSVWLLMLTATVGIVSNIAQVWYTPGQLFGGMSGVIYGYLGFIVLWQRWAPTAAYELPRGIVVFMLAWLFICMAGFTELVGLGAIANAAHIGGLVSGVFVAAIALLFRRISAG